MRRVVRKPKHFIPRWGQGGGQVGPQSVRTPTVAEKWDQAKRKGGRKEEAGTAMARAVRWTWHFLPEQTLLTQPHRA